VREGLAGFYVLHDCLLHSTEVLVPLLQHGLQAIRQARHVDCVYKRNFSRAWQDSCNDCDKDFLMMV
jgi:hypothetical protein